MAVSAVVKDGQLVETASQASADKTSSTKSASAPQGYDKDSFLQLLVAQMKYQDPLEPTSNTEYISQYATFSQVEQLQNMAGTMDLTRASGMVGQVVEITTTDNQGETKYVEGVVEYVKYENGKAFVAIDGELYASDSVTAVLDGEYKTAYDLAEAFASSINKLPLLANLTLADEETIETLRVGYNQLTPYQQSFIDDSYREKLEEYVTAMSQMRADSDASSKAAETQANAGDSNDESDKVNEAEEA